MLPPSALTGLCARCSRFPSSCTDDGRNLPQYTREEVAQRRSRADGGRVWVTYRNGGCTLRDSFRPGLAAPPVYRLLAAGLNTSCRQAGGCSVSAQSTGPSHELSADLHTLISVLRIALCRRLRHHRFLGPAPGRGGPRDGGRRRRSGAVVVVLPAPLHRAGALGMPPCQGPEATTMTRAVLTLPLS